MKTILISFFSLALLFTACENNSDTAGNQTQEPAEQETMTAVSDGLSLSDPELEGKRWIIVEVNGQPVVKSEQMRQTPFIHFHSEDTRVHAYAGCNQMSGTYELAEGNRIRFSALMSTKMACEDMSLEDQMGKIFEQIDNYSISDDMLSLNRARMAPLVRLRAE